MNIGNNSSEQLRSIIERAVNLETQKKEIGDDIKDLYAEARGNGFDPAALKALMKEQLEDATKRNKRAELEVIKETYRAALGDLVNLPLGQAALERVA